MTNKRIASISPDPLSTTPATRIVIEADSRIFPLDLRLLWEYRELLMFMIWREWSVRYKQTALGVSWVVLQPIATTIIFSVVFGLFIRAPSDGLPYPVFFLAGFVPWKYFIDALNRASSSLISNAHLVDKVYFPRLIMPLAGIITALSDFLFSFGVLLVAVVLFGISPFSIKLLVLPLFLLLAILTATALGLWFAALNVRYRDVGHFIPFLIQILMYASPIIYPVSVVQEVISPSLLALYRLNPIASVVEGFRWVLLDAPPPEFQFVALSSIGVLVLLAGGLLYFSRMEQTFGDII